MADFQRHYQMRRGKALCSAIIRHEGLGTFNRSAVTCEDCLRCIEMTRDYRQAREAGNGC